MTKVVDKIDRHRRHFIGAAVLAVAAAELGLARPTFAQAKSPSLPVVKPGTNTSFGTLKQIEAGTLNVGYAEAGPTNGKTRRINSADISDAWACGNSSHSNAAAPATKGVAMDVPEIR